jgi:hypothetical protein
MRQGTQDESMTPGTNEQYSWAGALPLATGNGRYGLGPRTNNGVFRELLTLLDHTDPASEATRIYVVVDHYCMHQAKAGEPWWAHHPRLAWLWFPTYCPRAHPSERVCGDVHDTCTRHHQRKRRRDLVKDVERHMEEHGRWKDKLSHRYDAPAVPAAVEHIAAEQQAKMAA